MKIKAIRNTLTEEESLIYHGNKDLHRYNKNVKIGEVSEVWYLVISKSYKAENGPYEFGTISYADQDGRTHYSIFFEIVDNKIPPNWIMTEVKSPWPETKFILGPREIFENDPQGTLNDIIGYETSEGAQKWYEYVVKTKRERGENPYTVLKENITL